MESSATGSPGYSTTWSAHWTGRGTSAPFRRPARPRPPASSRAGRALPVFGQALHDTRSLGSGEAWTRNWLNAWAQTYQFAGRDDDRRGARGDRPGQLIGEVIGGTAGWTGRGRGLGAHRPAAALTRPGQYRRRGNPAPAEGVAPIHAAPRSPARTGSSSSWSMASGTAREPAIVSSPARDTWRLGGAGPLPEQVSPDGALLMIGGGTGSPRSRPSCTGWR